MNGRLNALCKKATRNKKKEDATASVDGKRGETYLDAGDNFVALFYAHTHYIYICTLYE